MKIHKHTNKIQSSLCILAIALLATSCDEEDDISLPIINNQNIVTIPIEILRGHSQEYSDPEFHFDLSTGHEFTEITDVYIDIIFSGEDGSFSTRSSTDVLESSFILGIRSEEDTDGINIFVLEPESTNFSQDRVSQLLSRQEFGALFDGEVSMYLGTNGIVTIDEGINIITPSTINIQEVNIVIEGTMVQ